MSGIHTTTAATQGSASLIIEAPPKRVWPLVSDPTGMGRFSPENAGARWRDGATRAAVGARFRGFNRRGPFVWYTECVVRRCERNSVFSFDVTFPPVFPLIAQWTWVLEPVARGNDPKAATRVILTWKLPAEIDPARRLMWKVLGVGERSEDLTRGAATTLRALAEYLSSGRESSG